ncbi:hypothetical protein DERF_009479 [Dermatophagoides farinae]|uniref:Uncharacterized protein n=1 Tax=Dermatophagoides farinae TaxID=6954 RepID=A0A922HU46_DERFA|nr:hypothetical protein DERF_009479 [Dermatophagoides farinae]
MCYNNLKIEIANNNNNNKQFILCDDSNSKPVKHGIFRFSNLFDSDQNKLKNGSISIPDA